MASKEVGDLLEECLRAATPAAGHRQHSQAGGLNFSRCRDSLPPELASLLLEAEDMRWPFVPEKWQYKTSISSGDKTNLNDLISRYLAQLLDFLKVSIVAQEARAALAVAFLVDRFLYWTDESGRLLKVVRLLHRRHPEAPVAPQLVIRQARVYLNTGKLQKAEYILSSLINNSGTTGCWLYHSESDRTLVQAVSVQVRGVILQKLGLWLQAAELIWASLVGYYALPQPDKKGIGTSLGILANILMSMNDHDFQAFKNNPGIDLSLLGEGGHRLLAAAEAAKMAVVYSQYASLYVLTNVVIQGTCLLSYGFSVECPQSEQRPFLLRAQEAFAIGLLTKAEGEPVTSQQELHALLKAAYSLAVTHKWLGTAAGVVAQATQTCREALVHFYGYCQSDGEGKDGLCGEIMRLIARVKSLFQVEPFPNSDRGSFIPDSYRNMKDPSVGFTLEGFSKVMQGFKKYHASACQTSNVKCKAVKDEVDGAGLCITALMTTTGALNTECATETGKVFEGGANCNGPPPEASASSRSHQSQTADTETSEDLGSSWGNLPLLTSASPPSSSIAECQNKKQDSQGPNHRPSSHPLPRSTIPSSSSSGGSSKFELLPTVDDELDDLALDGSVSSLSQLALRTPTSSLGDSFGSRSSWVKLSADASSPTQREPGRTSLAQTRQSSKSSDSSGSFFLMETESSDSGWDLPEVYPTPQRDTSKPRSLENLNLEVNPSRPQSASPVQDLTSLGSSFEILRVDESAHQGAREPRRNPLCRSCQRPDSSFALGARYVLSQQDYHSLLAGICHPCLMRRLHSDTKLFKLKQHEVAHNALHLKFSKATGVWTARETCVYVGPGMDVKVEGKQRTAVQVQFLHQEERLSRYVGKDYKNPKGIQMHLKDVERQMTAQYYVSEFNRRLYDKEVMTQIFFIPSEALLILDGDEIVGCVSVEPFMEGKFVKLTNNSRKKDLTFDATNYGLAFGHFTYLLSGRQEVVVDLQGWVTANGKGLTYLTDPQIHSTRTPKGPSNFAEGGIQVFLKEQHGPQCNKICDLLNLPPVAAPPTLH